MKKSGRGRFFTPFAITQIVLCATVGFALWLAYLPWRWERTKDKLRNRFPSVRQIDSNTLTGWLAKSTEPKPILIDVRPRADYDFSHLPQALHMAVSDTPGSLGFPEETDELLIVYDGVGEGSFSVAESLIKRGYARVQVLEGGIFEWANRGLPLDGASGRTGRVQAGKSEFSGLLKHSATAP